MNPSGRLPYTYPSQQAALVTYWDAPSQLCVDAKGGYVRCPVAFDFGTGLSYTTFAYSGNGRVKERARGKKREREVGYPGVLETFSQSHCDQLFMCLCANVMQRCRLAVGR